MENERFDAVIDEAAKELMVDAPDELLTGVMYLIEKDAKPKRRFAFGRFTAFGAVAAAILIIIGIQSRSENGGGLLDGMNTFSGNATQAVADSASPNEAPAPMAMPETAMMDDYGVAMDTEDETLNSGKAMDTGAAENPAFGTPPELSLIEQELYSWAHSQEKELVSTSVISETESELVAIVVFDTETVEVTITERDGQFEVSYSEVQKR